MTFRPAIQPDSGRLGPISHRSHQLVRPQPPALPHAIRVRGRELKALGEARSTISPASMCELLAPVLPWAHSDRAPCKVCAECMRRSPTLDVTTPRTYISPKTSYDSACLQPLLGRPRCGGREEAAFSGGLQSQHAGSKTDAARVRGVDRGPFCADARGDHTGCKKNHLSNAACLAAVRDCLGLALNITAAAQACEARHEGAAGSPDVAHLSHATKRRRAPHSDPQVHAWRRLLYRAGCSSCREPTCRTTAACAFVAAGGWLATGATSSPRCLTVGSWCSTRLSCTVGVVVRCGRNEDRRRKQCGSRSHGNGQTLQTSEKAPAISRHRPPSRGAALLRRGAFQSSPRSG